MIKEILKLINDTGIVNESELTETIGASQPIVQQAIALLQSKGYLALLNLNQPCEEVHCASCSHCKPQQQTSKYAYTVTEKGKKYLNSQ